MSQGQRYRLESVQPVADMLHTYLEKTGKITTAGSVRRQASTVGDIETVFIGPEPRLLMQLEYMLFNGVVEPLQTMKRASILRHGKRFYQFMLFPPPSWDVDIPWIKWDLFVVLPPADHTVILWQRTGPTTYTQEMYLNGLKKPQYRICQGAVWHIAEEDRGYTQHMPAVELAKLIRGGSVSAQRLRMQDEEDLYNRAFLVPYTEPADRTPQTLSEQLSQLSEIDRKRMLLNNPEVI